MCKQAAQKLFDMGYTNIYEFGGINIWDGDVVTEDTSSATEDSSTEIAVSSEEKKVKMIIGDTGVPVTWEDNASVTALRELLPMTIQMSMYGGFEQVGSIGQSITRDDKQTTTSHGDIVLYSGNQIALFYGSNTWSYTRLGHVELTQQEMAELLGNGDVTITITEE